MYTFSYLVEAMTHPEVKLESQKEQEEEQRLLKVMYFTKLQVTGNDKYKKVSMRLRDQAQFSQYLPVKLSVPVTNTSASGT